MALLREADAGAGANVVSARLDGRRHDMTADQAQAIGIALVQAAHKARHGSAHIGTPALEPIVLAGAPLADYDVEEA